MTRSFSIPNPLNPEDADRLFLQIKQALLQNIQVLNPIIRKRFGKIRSWKLFRSDVAFEDKGEVIDLVFELEKETPQRYLLIDLSVPCLGKGQKYSLDAKAAHFHEEFDIPLARLKKAILLVKKGNESVPFGSSRLQVPILEISLRRLFGETTNGGDEEEGETRGGKKTAFAKDLLLSLKEAIVHESLATLQKRRNKYVRRGLWRWLEREILDPNVHFFLIILSSIYQGKTSEVLSRQFTTLDQYTRQPDQVIEKLFSNETGLAPEVAQAADRHRKALQKFLECFAATPPYEYLRSLFLKEFRSTRDSQAARIAVFDTLRELLARCGFTGEKEVQYPLEILDELGIFQGLLMGNYAELRVENATKKLQQLVPDRPWSPEDVYKLRDELAQLLHLPPAEFNLNAFLPQTFSQGEGQRGRSRTAGAESRNRSAENDFGGFEEGGVPAAQVPSRAAVARAATQARAALAQAAPAAASPTPPAMSADPATTATNGAAEPAARILPLAQGPADALANGTISAPPPPLPPRPALQPPRTAGSSHGGQPSRPPQQGQANPRPPQPANQQRHGHQPGQPGGGQPPADGAPAAPRPPQQPPAPQAPRPFQKEVDEARHRHFENFGGHSEEDPDALLFALEMDRAPVPVAAPTTPRFEEEFDPALEMPPRKKPKGQQEPGKPTFTAVYDPMAPRDSQQRRRGSSGRRRSKGGKRRHHGGGQRPPPPRP